MSDESDLSLDEWFHLASLLGRAMRQFRRKAPVSKAGLDRDGLLACVESARNVVGWQLREEEEALQQRFASTFDSIADDAADDAADGDEDWNVDAAALDAAEKARRRRKPSKRRTRKR